MEWGIVSPTGPPAASGRHRQGILNLALQGFYGTYEHQVDSKGRFSLPVRIRQALPPHAADVIVLVRGLDECLYGFALPAFEEMQQKVGNLGLGSPDARAVMESVGKSASFCDIDAQGRVLVPPKTLEMAGIRQSVVITGAVKYFAVWSPENYEAHEQKMQEAYKSGMARFFSGQG